MQTDFRSIRDHLTNRDGVNRKPFRTAAQKQQARATAYRVDGHWVSNAPVSYHPEAKRSRKVK